MDLAEILSVKVIVPIIIAIVVIVLVVEFAIGGFNGVGGTQNSQTALQSFNSSCISKCSSAQSSGSIPTAWCSFNTTISGTLYNCYDLPAGTSTATCRVNIPGEGLITYGIALGDRPC